MHSYQDVGDVPKKWLITIAVMLGAFLSVMDASIINVALPFMMGNYGQTLSAITWVATSYSITAIIIITMTGWLTTLMGRKNLLLWSFVIFTVGSILCGTAHTFTQMLIYRIIQGIGGGSLVPLSQAILRETFPKRQHGMAMAIFGMGIVLAPALGPILGGWLIDHYGWPWIFYINIPFSLLGLWMIWQYIHDPDYLKRGVKSVDWIGISLLTIGLTGLQIVLERGQEKNWFDSSFIIIWSMIAFFTLVGLVLWELRSKEPIIDFRVLRNLPLTLGSTVVFLFGIALFGTTFILPQFTQTLLGYPAYQSGLVILPRAIALFFCMPLIGKLYNHVEAKFLIICGILLTGFSYSMLAHISLNMAFENFVPMLVLMGIGMGFIFVPLSTAALSTISRPNMTQAASFYTLMQRIGGNVGYALTVTILTRRMQFHRAQLVQNINASSGNFQVMFHQFAGYLHSRGYGAVQDKKGALFILDKIVKQQAAMLSYNDLSWLFMLMFFAIVGLVVFMPRNKHHHAGPSSEKTVLVD
jgi:DHA2 family multidrug resistance protein